MAKFCACGSQKNYTECCGPYLSGRAHAPTPEALMRSRYSAFKRGDLAYIAATQKGAAETAENHQQSAVSAKLTWFKLEILAQSLHEGQQQGTVEFKADYQYHGQKHTLHEVSNFVKEGERWIYVDGLIKTHCC